MGQLSERSGTGLSDELGQRLEALALAEVLLVACDFDGTLAPIVERPEDARPLEGGVAALRALAAIGRTHVAVVSGRARDDLSQRCGLDQVVLVGSHGAEIGDTGRLDGIDRSLLEAVWSGLDEVAAGHAELRVERKPSGAALHYRGASDALARRTVRAVVTSAGQLDGARLRHGKAVVEVSVVDADKGDALRSVRTAVGATATLYVGDDATDEDAFRVLGPDDVGLKVGEGATLAEHRVDDPTDVVTVLEALVAQRRRMLGQ